MTSHDLRVRPLNERYCTECKIQQVRRGQITCGQACRKKRQRRQEQARLSLPLAMYELGKIRESIKRKERVPDFIADLKRLRMEIDDLLLLAGDIDAKERNAMITQRKIHW